LEQKIVDALDHMGGLGYSAELISKHRRVWTKFSWFVAGAGAPETISHDLVAQFLATRGIVEPCPGGSLGSEQRLYRSAMRMLEEFSLHGCYQRRRSICKSIVLSAAAQRVLNDYEHFACTQLGVSQRTMRLRRQHLTGFIHFLDSHGVSSFSTITPDLLSSFVASRAHLRSPTLALIVSNLRSFLRFLTMQGAVPASLTEQVPKVRIRKDALIPSVWKREDVDALLAAVDRGSPRGRRDYAILLLAARLGLRVGDIRSLKLENIRWDVARIDFRQQKTGAPQSLPLSEEVGSAIIAYLRDGRPRTVHREVFLKSKAPFEPFGRDNNLYDLISKYRRMACIELPPRTRRGMNALRHSIASRLLEVGTPLAAVAGILGHLSEETARIYTKVDIAALRTAAIDAEALVHA